MKTLALTLIPAALALALAGCAEAPQELKSSHKKSRAEPYTGADNSYVDKGWEAGNRDSWVRHLNQRAQAQNEYVRAN